jgi:hypothetical protein
MNTTTRNINKLNKWNAEDRQAFADRNFVKAKTIPNKKRLASRKACRPGNWD